MVVSSSNLTAGPSRRSSNASQRPPQRPSSAASRPISSLSVRPVSRISQRPNSRLSRPPTRHSSRLLPFIQTLVTQITGTNAEHGADKFRALVEQASKGLEYTTKAAASVDITVVDKQIRGHAFKARINSRDELSQALELSYQKLKTEVQQHTDVDQEIKLSSLPSHLQFLMMLSRAPSLATLSFAETHLESLRNPPQPSPSLTWKEILDGDPFEGQHWEGVYGLPPGSTVESWETHSDDSTPSLSSLDDSDDLDDTRSSFVASEHMDDADIAEPSIPDPLLPSKDAQHTYYHRKEFEDFQARQYWRPEWHIDANTARAFDIEDASTLSPAFQRSLWGSSTILGHGFEQETYINEVDAVREVLMALQGRKNLIIEWNEDTLKYIPASKGPQLLHLTPDSLTSIMSFFARTATSVDRLRKFTSHLFGEITAPFNKLPHSTNSRCNTRTIEAFADAVDQEIRAFDRWCAKKEEDICRVECSSIGPSLTVSLLSLEKDIQDTYSESFEALLDVIQQVVDRAVPSSSTPLPIWLFTQSISQTAPANVTANLLDLLIQMVQDQLSIGNNVTSEVLMRIFARSAEPVWAMVGRWIKNGMPVRDPSGHCESYGDSLLEDEFFIEDDDMLLVDPDFWKDGYTLRDRVEPGYGATAVPAFLAHVAEHILSSGKAIGLLRALGVQLSDVDKCLPSDWQLFTTLLNQEVSANPQNPSSGLQTQPCTLLSLSTDRLSQVVYDVLLPYCETTGAQLTKALVEDFDVMHHLSAIEELYLMRRGDAMSHFADVLFAKMDANQSWTDFHFLNTAFSDVVDVSAAKWIKPSLVRLSYRGSKDRAVNRTVRAIEGILTEYAVYCSVFVFLLQIRRAKSVLERILVRGAIANSTHDNDGLKVFYAMRSKLSWFVNALLNFLTTYVIHAQVLEFRDAFIAAQSLDEMIQLHDDYIVKIQGRCLLRSNTSALHRAILSILDMCLHFADFFVTFAGDATLDISRRSIKMKRHRSRRQRRQRRDVIGFSQSLRDTQYSSDDDDSDEDAQGDTDLEPPESSSFLVGVSFTSSVEDDPANRLDKMSSELDGLVRFIRRGVESLAGGTSEAAPAFGVLAFALEDWDM